MKRFFSLCIGVILAVGLHTGCSQDQLDQFQANDPYPPYNLLNLFDGFPSLKEAIDGLSTQRINDGLGRMLDQGIDMPEFLRIAVELVEAPFLAPMLGELGEMLGVLRDEVPSHYDHPSIDHAGFYEAGLLTASQRRDGFHGALDTVIDNTDLSGDILDIAAQVVNYLATEKSPMEIEETMGEMTVARVYQHCMYDDAAGYAVDLRAGTYTTAQLAALGIANNDVSSLEVPIGMKITLYDGDGFSGTSLTLTGSDRCLTDESMNDLTSSIKVEYDISNLAKLLGKVTMSCDYPMWVNASHVPATNRDNANTGVYTTNTDLGNAVKGVNKLLKGLNGVAAEDEELRYVIYDMLQQDLPALLNAANGTSKIKSTIINLSEYFAPDEIGNNVYDTVADYHNANPYVNASLQGNDPRHASQRGEAFHTGRRQRRHGRHV